MTRPNRRQFLAAAGVTLAGCARPAPQSRESGEFAGQELRVFVYAGGHDAAMREAFVPRFEAATGATVSLQPGWWDAIPKLKAAPAGDPPFDLVVSDATQGYPAVKDGLFQTLDFDNIPNHKLMTPSALDNWVARDRYGVTYPDSVMTLAFDRRAVPDAPARWSDLLRRGLAGKLGLYNAFYMSLYTFACVMADSTGKPGTARDLVEADLDGVLRFAREHRDRVKVWWPSSTDMVLALTNGDCAAGNMHSPEYLQALRERPHLGAAVPAADRAFVQVFWSIPAGSKNKALAEKAIDVLFSPEVQLGLARKGSATALPEVAATVAAEDALWGQLYPHTPEQFRGLRYYPYEAYAAHWDGLADAWDRTVLRKG